MEKKAAKKAPKKTRTAVPKAIELKSPWADVAADLPVLPAPRSSSPTRSKKSTKAKRSEPPAIAVGLTPTVAKSIAVNEAKSEPKTVSAKAEPEKTTALLISPFGATAEIAAAEPQVELSPVFKTLAAPTLPELKRENRARLMMQTPGKLYFYWSVRENPYHLLRKVFGNDLGSYALVLKLTELQRGIEEFHRAEAEGNWWFDVEPDGKYEAEIGFYAPNRPYFRVLYSNTVETPRRSPSPRVASDMDWRVSASKFAEALDVAGFSQDAFDVALAGDDTQAAEHVTQTAFSHFIGNGDHDLRGIAAEDIRYTLMALAAGSKVDELRSRISPALYAILQANAKTIAGGNAMSVLTEYFDIDETEFTEREHGSAVFGSSRVHFPRSLKTRPRYNPVSSHSFR